MKPISESLPIQVFTYLDPIQYLNDCIKQKQQKNPSFSLRAWARDLEISQATTLSQILNNKRPMPMHYIPLIAKSLKLSLPEAKYLESITGVKNAKTPMERALWTKAAQKIILKAAYNVDWMDEFEFFKDPFLHVLLNLIDTKDFKNEPSWIKEKMLVDTTEDQIKEGLDLLLRKGLIKLDQKQKIVRTSKHVAAKHDSASLAVKKFHEASLNQAINAVYTQTLDEREFGSYLFALDDDDLPEIKAEIREFTSELIAKYSHTKQPKNKVYHLNVNLFAQTKDESK